MIEDDTEEGEIIDPEPTDVIDLVEEQVERPPYRGYATHIEKRPLNSLFEQQRPRNKCYVNIIEERPQNNLVEQRPNSRRYLTQFEERRLNNLIEQQRNQSRRYGTRIEEIPQNKSIDEIPHSRRYPIHFEEERPPNNLIEQERPQSIRYPSQFEDRPQNNLIDKGTPNRRYPTQIEQRPQNNSVDKLHQSKKYATHINPKFYENPEDLDRLMENINKFQEQELDDSPRSISPTANISNSPNRTNTHNGPHAAYSPESPYAYRSVNPRANRSNTPYGTNRHDNPSTANLDSPYSLYRTKNLGYPHRGNRSTSPYRYDEQNGFNVDPSASSRFRNNVSTDRDVVQVSIEEQIKNAYTCQAKSANQKHDAVSANNTVMNQEKELAERLLARKNLQNSNSQVNGTKTKSCVNVCKKKKKQQTKNGLKSPEQSLFASEKVVIKKEPDNDHEYYKSVKPYKLGMDFDYRNLNPKVGTNLSSKVGTCSKVCKKAKTKCKKKSQVKPSKKVTIKKEPGINVDFESLNLQSGEKSNTKEASNKIMHKACKKSGKTNSNTKDLAPFGNLNAKHVKNVKKPAHDSANCSKILIPKRSPKTSQMVNITRTIYTAQGTIDSAVASKTTNSLVRSAVDNKCAFARTTKPNTVVGIKPSVSTKASMSKRKLVNKPVVASSQSSKFNKTNQQVSKEKALELLNLKKQYALKQKLLEFKRKEKELLEGKKKQDARKISSNSTNSVGTSKKVDATNRSSSVDKSAVLDNSKTLSADTASTKTATYTTPTKINPKMSPSNQLNVQKPVVPTTKPKPAQSIASTNRFKWSATSNVPKPPVRVIRTKYKLQNKPMTDVSDTSSVDSRYSLPDSSFTTPYRKRFVYTL